MKSTSLVKTRPREADKGLETTLHCGVHRQKVDEAKTAISQKYDIGII